MSGFLRPAGPLDSPLRPEYVPVAEDYSSGLEGITEAPGPVEKFGAMFNRENVFQSTLNYYRGHPGAWTEEEQDAYQSGRYSWLDSAEEDGYMEDEDMLTALSEARTPREYDWIRNRVTRQREDLDTISRMSLPETFLYGIPAVIFDPALAPFLAMKAPTAVSRLAQAGYGAKQGLYGSALAEVGLQATQDVRTLGESALNVGASVGFGSVAQYLFSVPARVKVGAIHRKAQMGLDEYEVAHSNAQLRDQQYVAETRGGEGEVTAAPESTENPFLAPSSAGAARFYDDRLVNPSVARALEVEVDARARKAEAAGTPWDAERMDYELQKGLLAHSQEWTGLKNASTVAWGATFTPSRKVASSRSPTARLLYEHLVEDSWVRNRNVGPDGVPSTQSLSTQNQAELNRMRMQTDEIVNTFYRNYAKRVPKGARLTKTEFAEEIGKARRRKDPHEIHEVATAAGLWGERIAAPLEQKGLKWGVIKEDPISGQAKGRVGDEVFLWRLTDVHRMRLEGDRWKKILRTFYGDREMAKLDKKFQKTGEMPDEEQIAEIMTSLDEWIEGLYRSITNTHHGNVEAALVGVTKEISESNRFKASTLDIPSELIEDFLVKDIRSVTESVARSVVPQYNLMERFYTPGDEIDLGLKAHYDAVDSDYALLTKMQLEDLDAGFMRKNKQGPDTFKRSKKQESEAAKLINKLYREKIRTIKRLEFGHKAAMLQNPHNYDPESAIVKMLRTARAMNVFSKLGKMAISAFPDIGLTFMRNGTALMPATVRAIKGKEMQVTLSNLEAAVRGAQGTAVQVSTKKELQRMAVVTETSYLGRIGEISDLSHPDPGAGRLNSFLTWGLHKFGTATGMNHWNQTGKIIAAHSRLADLYEIVHTPVSSRSKTQVAELRRLGISEPLAQKMRQAWDSQNIHTTDKTYIPIFSAQSFDDATRATREAAILQKRAQRKQRFVETETKSQADKIRRKERGIEKKYGEAIKQYQKQLGQARKEYKFAATKQGVRRAAKKEIDRLTGEIAEARKAQGEAMDKLNKDAEVIMESATKTAEEKFDKLLAESPEYRPADYTLIWDFETQDAIRSALTKASNESIITPGIGERPRWMTTPAGAMVGQFLSFPMAVMGKAVGPALQRGDLAGRVIAGGLMTIPLVMLSQYFKYLAKNNYEFSQRDFEEYMSSPRNWTQNVIYHTGLLGIHTELLDMGDLASSGRLAQALGLRDDDMTRFEAESRIYSRLGAGIGLYQDLWSVTMGAVDVAAGDGFSKKRVRDARYIMPFQNHPAFQPIFNHVQEALSK